jgi:hypothetical protein
MLLSRFDLCAAARASFATVLLTSGIYAKAGIKDTAAEFMWHFDWDM